MSASDPVIFPSDLSPEAAARALRLAYFTALYGRALRSSVGGRPADLAALLGVRRWEIARAHRKRRLPNEWILRLCFDHGISPYWLLTGNGPMRLPGVPGRNTRPGRVLQTRIVQALFLYENMVAAECSRAFIVRLLARRKAEPRSG